MYRTVFLSPIPSTSLTAFAQWLPPIAPFISLCSLIGCHPSAREEAERKLRLEIEYDLTTF